MRVELSDQTRVLIGRVMAIVAGIVGAAALVIQALVDAGSLYDEWIIHNGGGAILLAGLGWLMVSVQPRNRAVWIFPWIALFQGLNAIGSALASSAIDGRRLPPDVTGLSMAELGWIGAIGFNLEQWSWLPGITPIITLALLWFPDGKPLSSRWKPVEWLALSSIGVLTGLLIWIYRPLPNVVILSEDLVGPVAFVGFLALLAAIVLSIAGLVARYRRSSGERRRQLRWIAWSSGTTAVLWLAANVYDFAVSGLGGGAAFKAVSLASLPLFFGGYAVAIWRQQLFDIDVVISRTVLFGSLALFIGMMYIGIVSGVGTLIGRSGNDQGLPLAATILVAFLFHPVRKRLEHAADRLVYGRRTTPYEVLSDLSSRLNRAETADGLLDRVVLLLAEGTGATRATVWQWIDPGYAPVSVWPPNAIVEPMLELTSDCRNGFVQPIDRAGRRLGALTVSMRRGEELSPTEQRLVDDLAGSIGLVLDKVRLDAALADQADALFESRRRLVDAQDDERRRLERQLNTGIHQRLTNLADGLVSGSELAAADGIEAIGEQLLTLADQARLAQDEIHALAQGVYPPLLEVEGLTAAVEDLVKSLPVTVEVTSTVHARLDPEIELAVYFSIAEALTNAIKYSEASHIAVLLRCSGDDGPDPSIQSLSLQFSVSDDGVGFSYGGEPGTGLVGLRDRLEAVGGRLTVRSTPGEGVIISGSVAANRLATVG